MIADSNEIAPDEMGWVIHVKPVEMLGEIEPWFKLSWGWTANLTPEEIANLADDCPKGEDHVLVNKWGLIDLQNKIENAIKEIELWKPSHETIELKKEYDCKSELFSQYLDEIRNGDNFVV